MCEDSIIDLMPIADIGATESLTKVEGSAGHPVNHVCLALSESEYDALDRRLQAAGVDTSARLSRSYGARGWAPQGLLLLGSRRQCGRGALLRRVINRGNRRAHLAVLWVPIGNSPPVGIAVA